jgi:hypothetical protein
MNYTQDQVNAIVAEAKTAAFEAADKFFKEKLGGRDQYACGFAWTNIYKVKGNTKLHQVLPTVESSRLRVPERGHFGSRC